MSDFYKDRILKHLQQQGYRPKKVEELAGSLGVQKDDYEDFESAFVELLRAGRVITGSGNLISLPPLRGTIIGTFRANPKGFGFVVPLEPKAHGDLFISPNETHGAMSGDIVSVKVVRKGRQGPQMRFTGKELEVIERAENRLVGTLGRHPEGWLVEPDGSSFIEPISVEDVTAKNAKENDKVVVEILSYPTRKYFAHGVIIEVLGKSGKYDSEINSIIHQYHLAYEFDQQCLNQARESASGFKPRQIQDRQDITNKVIITIDPPDAKDFDDAISLEKDTQGNWQLGVHIADVARFVEAGSQVDCEAENRGNSVYLPGRTIPMLPEILSNGVCSLQPGQERLVKSVYLTYDSRGNVLSRRYSNSVIRSTQRLTYQQADAALRGNTKGIKPEVVSLLRDTEALSRVIESRRRAAGMIHLDLPEMEVELDAEGEVVDVHPADESYPHTIIEMFMVEANEAVASLFDRLNLAFIRRIHPEPDKMTLKNLSKLVRAFGLSMPKNPDRYDIQELLASVKGKDCSYAVNMTVLRSFEKACYAPSNVGHYALASRHYCHFTSPIRRYADLTVHRLLEYYLQGRIDNARENQAGKDLTQIGKHISFAEERAEDAEEELKTVLILQMLKTHIGEELDGIVSGITGFGVFVQLKRYGIEGLIRLAELAGDVWKHNLRTQSLVGSRSGRSIHLGQAIKVKLISVNVAARQMNLAPAGKISKSKAKGKGKKQKGRGRKVSSKSGKKGKAKEKQKTKKPQKK